MNGEAIVAVICAFMSSAGLWAFINSIANKKSASSQMVKGIGHALIIEACRKALDRGFTTTEEYDTIINYLWMPYSKLGGNGTAEKMVELYKELDIK